MTDIDEVKSRTNIVDVIGARVTLKKAGRNFKGLCPFHNEKTPSFMVSPDRQSWHCFGCAKGGSVIDFVMEYERVDFVEALTTLAEKAGVKLDFRQGETPQAKLKTNIFEVNHLASEYYHYILMSHAIGEKAREYLKYRGVSDKTAKTFMLGYSPGSWDGLTKYLKKKGYDEGLLEAAGLFLRSGRGGYDRFRGRVMFTLKDHRGNVVGFSGRLMDKNAKEAKYINTSETPVYTKGNVLYGFDVTKDAIQKANEAILMEGEFDLISSYQEGIGNAVAIKGSALTEGHVNLLRRFTDRVVFALDSDMAGDAAARRGIEIADRAGLDMKVASMPQGKDPDEAVRENPLTFKKALKEAVPIYDYFMSSAVRRFGTDSAYGKKKISQELLPLLSKIENPVVQSHYVKKLAELLEVDEQAVTSGIRKAASGFLASKNPPPQPVHPDYTGAEKLEIYVLALILQTRTEEFFEELKEKIQLEDFTHGAVRQIIEALAEYLSRGNKFFIRDFADSLPTELHAVLDEAFLWDLSAFIDNEELVAREWIRVMREFQKSILRKKIKNLTVMLNGSGLSEEDESYSAMQQTLTRLTEKFRDLEKSSVI